MRCPRCGLVHAPMDLVCRRCEIDLRTGEPRAREAECPAPAGPVSIGTRLKRGARAGTGALRSAAAAVPRPARDIDKHEEHKEHKEHKPPMPAPVIVIGGGPDEEGGEERDRRQGIIAKLPAGGGKGLKKIPCAQCGSSMGIARVKPFAPWWPFALLGAGAALGVAGLFFPLMWISAGLSVAAGVLYLRTGRTYWKCGACGFTISRAA